MSWESKADDQRCDGRLYRHRGAALRITAVSAGNKRCMDPRPLWQSTLTLPNVGIVSNVPRQRIVDLDEEVNAPVGRQRRGLTATAYECHFALHGISVYSTPVNQRMKSRGQVSP